LGLLGGLLHLVGLHRRLTVAFKLLLGGFICRSSTLGSNVSNLF
jgi:hypothetical protein